MTLRDVLTVIVPSYQRPDMLRRAIASLVNQDPPVSILVVDDGSQPPIDIGSIHPGVECIRLDDNAGGSAARNRGVRAVRTPWITFLDDDDEWLPGASAVVARAIGADQKQPSSFVAGLEVVDAQGRVTERRIAETREKGECYFLEPYGAGRSPLTKQTFVVPRTLFLDIGGFDEGLRSRIHSEFSLRLNAASRIVAIEQPIYRLHKHGGSAVSSDTALRRRSFDAIWTRHGDTMRSRPKGAAEWVCAHGERLLAAGDIEGALGALSRAMRLDARGTSAFVARKITEKARTLLRRTHGG